MKNNKLFISLFFILIGCLFTFLGIIIIQNSKNTKIENPKEAIAIITELNKSKSTTGTGRNRSSTYTTTPTIKYKVDGKEYVKMLSYYDSSMEVGKEITIKYDPENPNKLQETAGQSLIKFLPMLLGIAALIFGFTSIISKVIKSNNKRNLISTGEKIEAEFVEVILNEFIMNNNRNPYIITCKWKDPINGETYLFKTENIWNDPSDIIKKKNIKTFTVYIDKNNKKQYFVNLDNLYEVEKGAVEIED